VSAFHDRAIPGSLGRLASTQAGAEHVERLAQRLRQLVAVARQRSPFYRELYRATPAEDYRLADLPVVEKSGLMANFDAVVTDAELTATLVRDFVGDERRAGQPLLHRYAVWTSSGTTGEPGLFVHDGRALAVYEALQALRFRRLASPAALAAAFLADDRYALVGATGGHFAGSRAAAVLAASLAGRASARVFHSRAAGHNRPSAERVSAHSGGDIPHGGEPACRATALRSARDSPSRDLDRRGAALAAQRVQTGGLRIKQRDDYGGSSSPSPGTAGTALCM
jgi:hypothetical protein